MLRFAYPFGNLNLNPILLLLLLLPVAALKSPELRAIESNNSFHAKSRDLEPKVQTFSQKRIAVHKSPSAKNRKTQRKTLGTNNLLVALSISRRILAPILCKLLRRTLPRNNTKLYFLWMSLSNLLFPQLVLATL